MSQAQIQRSWLQLDAHLDQQHRVRATCLRSGCLSTLSVYSHFSAPVYWLATRICCVISQACTHVVHADSRCSPVAASSSTWCHQLVREFRRLSLPQLLLLQTYSCYVALECWVSCGGWYRPIVSRAGSCVAPTRCGAAAQRSQTRVACAPRKILSDYVLGATRSAPACLTMHQHMN